MGTSDAYGTGDTCVDVISNFSYYDTDLDQYVEVTVDITVCDGSGDDVFLWALNNGYDVPDHIVLDANTYSVTDLDSVTFTAEIVGDHRVGPDGWQWEPQYGYSWDPWTTACSGVPMTCTIQVHGSGQMVFSATPNDGPTISDSLVIIGNLPPDGGTDDTDADLPSDWDSGGSSSIPIGAATGVSIVKAADSSSKLLLPDTAKYGWYYTEGCAGCYNSQGQKGSYTEPAVNIPARYGDCTDFVWAVNTQVLGAAFPHKKINTKMFDTLSATSLAKHGYVEESSTSVQQGDVVIRENSSTHYGHAGIFAGWAGGASGGAHTPVAVANNGVPAGYNTPNQQRNTGRINLKPLTGYDFRFFRPQT